MEWFEQLPPHLRPSPGKARELEAFRQEIHCPHEPFARRILSSAWATRQIQGMQWNQLVITRPEATERELVEELYQQRKVCAAVMWQTAGLGEERGHPPLPATCNTFEEFCRFLAEYEAQFAEPDPLGWGRRIDEMLGYVV